MTTAERTSAYVNEGLYRRQMTKVGLCMLLQEILFFAPALLLQTLLYPVLEDLLSPVAAYTAEELLNGAQYLCAFFIPALILRRSVVITEPMPYTPVVPGAIVWLVPAAISMILAASVLNSLMMPTFYAAFSDEVLWNDAVSSNFQVVLTFITTALIPGVCEEFLFRGAVYTAMRPFGRTTAIVGSAVLFGLMHANAGQFFYAFAAGVIFALIREKTGSLWCGMLIHICNNAFSVVESALDERLAPEVADMVLFAVDAFVFILGILGVLMLLRRMLAEKEKKIKAETEYTSNFGVILPSAPTYVPYPLERGRALRLSLTVPMVFFLVISVGRALLFLLEAAAMYA